MSKRCRASQVKCWKFTLLGLLKALSNFLEKIFNFALKPFQPIVEASMGGGWFLWVPPSGTDGVRSFSAYLRCGQVAWKKI